MHAGTQQSKLTRHTFDIIWMEELVSNNSFYNGPIDDNANVVCLKLGSKCASSVGNWTIAEEMFFALIV
jgi:hypothetical protein